MSTVPDQIPRPAASPRRDDGAMHVTPSRVAFANQLRGVAVLCVVLIHYTVVYQLMRPTVAWVIAAPPFTGPVSPVAAWLFPPWLDAGAFGVALFFLISGFVIPLSLERTTTSGFLLARCLRIYPTFWVGLAVQWLAVGASAAYWDRPVVFGWPVFLRNALLVNTWFDGVSVDFVSWTLNVELKFYVIMAVFRAQILAARLWPITLVAAAAMALTLAGGGHIPPQLVQEGTFVSYMLIGTLFQYHYRGQIRMPSFVLGCLLLLVAGSLCWALGPYGEEWPRKPANYGYAVLVFGLAYYWRDRFRPSTLLDGLAAISYPLYLVHSVLGFTVMSFLIGAWRLPYLFAAVAALIVSVTAAWLLHISIEQATVNLGRRFRHPVNIGKIQVTSQSV